MPSSRSISVVVATYNGERHVREQLRSIVEQSRQADEILVGDDGSSDATRSIVDELLAGAGFPASTSVDDSRLGPAGNFGRGVARATGDIVVLADQDDVWAPNKLEAVERAFARDPGAVALFSDAALVDGDGRLLGRSLWESVGFTGALRRRWDDGDGLGVLLNRNVVTGATMAFRSSLRGLALPVPADSWHDHWLALLACVEGRLVALPEPLIHYRLHGANTMGVPARGLVDQVRERLGRGDIRTAELARLRAVRSRLEERGVAHPSFVARLDAKITHVEARACLGPRMATRMAPVVREAVRGRYHRYANGSRSIVVDLLGR
jgi:glycosyltransferase involved in cell wall biosynthesis